MVIPSDFGEFETAWCPGCGNFPILKATKKALASLDLAPHQVLFVSGIGQAAKAPHYLLCNAFNGLHGRALPPAQGAKLANPKLTVIAESGDGCSYGEGGNHFLAALRRNVNITLFAHDNQIYGLTKGQASPMTTQGMVTKTQPEGAPSLPFNPLAVAVAHKVAFVGRGFSGDIDGLAELMKQAILSEGFALLDILQPCVSFNKVNTFAWYKERVRPLPADYDPTDFDAAMRTALTFGDTIPTGVIYKGKREPFDAHLSTVGSPLATRKVDKAVLREAVAAYF